MLALALLLCSVETGSVTPSSPSRPDRPAPPALLDVRWEGPSLLTGRLARLEVRSTASPIVRLQGTLSEREVITLPASDDGSLWFALAPVYIESPETPAPLLLEATLEDGTQLHWRKPVSIRAAPYDERRLTVAKKFVKPSRRQRRRAAAESKALQAVLAARTSERLWRGSFAKPTAGGETSPFGTRRTYNNRRQSRHLGLDLDGRTGDAIVATNRGRVVMASDRFYTGGTVIIDHGQSLFSMYFHMSRLDVKVGDVVEKGQGIGAVGASGQVTGPHLHFSVKLAGLYVDPKHLLAMDLSADALDEPLTVSEARQAVP